MALNTQFSDTLVDAMAVAFATKFDNARMYVCTGTLSGSSTIGSNTVTSGAVLTVFVMPTPAFGSPTSGVLVANAIPTATAGATSGTATIVRIFDSTFAGQADNTALGASFSSNVLMECTAGTSNANLIISPITAGTNVSIGSFTHEVTNAFSGQ